MACGKIATVFSVLCLGAGASYRPSCPFPLYFEPNVGQTASVVKFAAHAQNYTVFLTPGGATLRAGTSVLKLSFVGANLDAQAEGLDPVDSRVHYLTGIAGQWHTDVPIYRRLEYGDISAGVDLV